MFPGSISAAGTVKQREKCFFWGDSSVSDVRAVKRKGFEASSLRGDAMPGNIQTGRSCPDVLLLVI